MFSLQKDGPVIGLLFIMWIFLDSIAYYGFYLFLVGVCIHYWATLPERQLSPVTSGDAVLITGSSTGIGFSAAIHLNSVGYTVYAGVRKPEDQRKLKDKAKHPERMIPVIIDVAKSDTITKAFEFISQDLGTKGLKGLFNNAGIGWEMAQNLPPDAILSNSFELGPRESVERLMAVNFFGSWQVTKTFWPLLRKASDSTVVFNTSVAGFSGVPFISAYCASKHALEGLADCLRKERRPSDPRIVILECGFVESDIVGKGVSELKKVTANHEIITRERKQIAMVEYLTSRVNEPAIISSRIVERAFRSKSPHARYLTGGASWSSYFIEFWMPTWASDSLSFLVDKYVDKNF